MEKYKLVVEFELEDSVSPMILTNLVNADKLYDSISEFGTDNIDFEVITLSKETSLNKLEQIEKFIMSYITTSEQVKIEQLTEQMQGKIKLAQDIKYLLDTIS